MAIKVFHAPIWTVRPFNYGFAFAQVRGRRKPKKWMMFLGMRHFGQKSGIFAHVADLSQRRSLMTLAGWKGMYLIQRP